MLEGSMGTPRSGCSERLRTVWTPEMDRHFIDLMLEQVKKGNRFEDHLFSKRAWKHMSSSFTAKFKFPYGKDVLKNRHKTLRNMYKTVKSLLEQEGFTWDERREMVVADSDAWDEYLKVNPDVRSLRIKSIPYYRDLCLIYADGISEQKGLSPHRREGTTVATPEEKATAEEGTEILIQGGEVRRGTDDSSNLASNAKGTTRSRTSWHPPMDRYFIDLMLDQVRRGNQIEGVFRKQAWTEMVESFNAKFESNYDVDVLKNRYKTLRRQHHAIKSLLISEGFSWDDDRQMVTADDSVWQAYIKVHKDARQFMTRPIPYYKDLCVLCGETSFDENDCLVAIDWFDPETELQELKSLETSSGSESPEPVISAEEDGNSSLLLDPKNKREQLDADTNPINPKKQRRDEADAAGSACTAIETAVMAVQALSDMDEDLILDACDLLEDEVKAKTFLALDAKLRKKWLLRKLRPQTT